MRILFLNWKDPRHPEAGGSEIVVFELARRLVRQGHAVTWFARRFPGCDPEDTLEGIRIVRRGGLLTTYLRAPATYLRFRPRPDLVVDVVNTLCWQTPLFAKGRSIAFVHQLAREALLWHLPWPLSHLAFGLERFQYVTYRRTLALCPSPSTRDDLVSVGIPATNTAVVRLGVDHERYRPGSKDPDPLFLFVGRLVPVKRVDRCIGAMVSVRARHPQARLVVLGRGPAEGDLRAQVASLGLADAVDFVSDPFAPGSPERTKIELMQRAWALVLPSAKEGWGMVVTEAAACGTPAGVTGVSGLRDSVEDGRTGIIVSPDPSPEELARALLRLVEDPELRRRLGEEARVQASALSWEETFRQFCELAGIPGTRSGPPAHVEEVRA